MKRPRRKPRDLETPIHVSILQYLEMCVPNSIVAHIPNGGQRSAAAGAFMKRLGTKAGMPDLMLMVAPGRTIFFEMKATNGYASPSQQAMAQRMQMLGFSIALVHSIDETKNALKALGVQTNEAGQ